MNIEQEIRAQIEKNKGLKLAVGEINNHLSILEGLLRNERDDVQKQVEDAYQRGYDKGYADKTNNDEVCKKLAKDIQDEAYQRGLEDGKHNGLGEVNMREALEYQRGLDDAWEAARKISILESDGGYSWKEMKSIFGTDSASEIYVLHTATEAINKIKAYEEKQKAEGEIKVGDEVEWDTELIVVTCLYMDGGFNWCDGIRKDGKMFHVLERNVIKTGRHFDIDKILGKMNE